MNGGGLDSVQWELSALAVSELMESHDSNQPHAAVVLTMAALQR